MERDPHDDSDRRSPPARHRGPVRPLSERAARFVSRAATTDRRELHLRRRRDVAEARRARRRRRLLTVVLSGVSTAAALVVVGALIAGPAGAAVGGGVVVLLLVGGLLVRRLAARRGALAWDWQLQRHRLMGNPSEHVRSMDEPGSDRSGPRRTWLG